MKIGILTFHRTLNYGAVLQCYALYELLRQKGHHVEVIDYRIPSVEDERKLVSLAILRSRKGILIKLKYLARNLLTCRTRNKAITAFNLFVERRFVMSSPVLTIKDIPSYYDCILFGSDQIWNPKLCGGFDPVFWGQFPKGRTRFIAYAASIGEIDGIGSDQWEQIGRMISSFDKVSVRESDLKFALEEKFSIPVQCCLDPTLMIDEDYFERIAVRPPEIDYVFIYNVQKDPYSYSFAKRLAEKLNCKVIRGQARPEIRNKLEVDCQLVEGISPEEFLGYIKYARYVVANSFHAIALSIVFKKNFYSLDCPKPGRVKNLLMQAGLLNRHLISQTEDLIPTEIDYSLLDCSIDNLRKESMRFIDEIYS